MPDRSRCASLRRLDSIAAALACLALLALIPAGATSPPIGGTGRVRYSGGCGPSGGVLGADAGDRADDGGSGSLGGSKNLGDSESLRASADSPAVPASMRPVSEPRRGEAAQRAPARHGSPPRPAPLLLQSVEARALVTGPVAHVTVTQAWENPNTEPLDGVYTFPLPENAALTDMSLRIGKRVIDSQIKRRDEARELYEQARREGRVAGLLDQQRPNVFTQRVANIVPGERIEVVLTFEHEIRCLDGSCSYVFPALVGPRFVPARQAAEETLNPPLLPPCRTNGVRFSLSVEIEAAVPIAALASPTHTVLITRAAPDRAGVVLARGAAMNRDFQLRWREGGTLPEAGVLAWRDAREPGEPGVFTLVLQPPARTPDKDATAREIVFVLDCSGSMQGMPLEASKRVVRKALGALRPADTFQIIRFSETASGLGPEPLAPTPENLRKALVYLDALTGEGGTEMISGIRAALAQPPDPDRLRLVAFLTDGYIGNESEILGEVRRLLGSARLFSFGIGSAVNRYLLESLAEEGRGAVAFLGPRESPDAMVERFAARIATPVLTDIHLTWQDLEVEDLEPAEIPDLFEGQPVVIHGRYRKPGVGLLLVEGRRGNRPFTRRVVVDLPPQASDHEALGRLWARARIHRLSRALHDGENPALREAIVALGLRYRLATEWTSFVAVDSAVTNRTGAATEVAVPVAAPEDTTYEGIRAAAGAQPVAMNSYGRGAALARARALPGNYAGGGGVVGGVLGGVLGGMLGDAPATASGTPLQQVDAKAISPRSSATREDAADSLAAGRLKQASGLEPSAARDGSAAGQGGAARKEAAKPELAFTRLTWTRADGTVLVIENRASFSMEGHGGLWLLGAGGERQLLRTLAADEADTLRRTIAAARPESWKDTGARATLVLEGPAGRFTSSLPSGQTPVAAIIELLREWAAP